MDIGASKKKAFEYKLGAAKYHLKQLKDIFDIHQQLFHNLASNTTAKTPVEIMPFFYHYDAFLYELGSCFDMSLYYLTEKHKLKISERNIGWNKEYRAELKAKCPKAFEAITKEYNEWWFEDLRTARNYIAHHDSPPLGMEYTEKGVSLLFFYIPRLHQRREMFEQCNIWGTNISKLFQTVEKI